MNLFKVSNAQALSNEVKGNAANELAVCLLNTAGLTTALSSVKLSTWAQFAAAAVQIEIDCADEDPELVTSKRILALKDFTQSVVAAIDSEAANKWAATLNVTAGAKVVKGRDNLRVIKKKASQTVSQYEIAVIEAWNNGVNIPCDVVKIGDDTELRPQARGKLAQAVQTAKEKKRVRTPSELLGAEAGRLVSNTTELLASHEDATSIVNTMAGVLAAMQLTVHRIVKGELALPNNAIELAELVHLVADEASKAEQKDATPSTDAAIKLLEESLSEDGIVEKQAVNA